MNCKSSCHPNDIKVALGTYLGLSIPSKFLMSASDLSKAKYGHRANSQAKPMKMITFDGSTIHLDKILKDYFDYAANPSEHIIHHSVSALYKHQQNLSELHIHHEKR
jgi:hypothetical protein